MLGRTFSIAVNCGRRGGSLKCSPSLRGLAATFSTSVPVEVRNSFHHARNALENSKAPAASPVTNEQKLRLYALFKQAETGPCTGSRPGMFDLVGRAKYDAWKSLGDMTAEKAMAEYVKGVKDIYGGELPTDVSPVKQASDSAPKPAQSYESSVRFKTFDDIMPRRLNVAEVDKFRAALQLIDLSVDTESGVGKVKLNRASKGNAFNLRMWDELKQSMETLHSDARVKSVILSGNDAAFSTGMDLSVFVEMQGKLMAMDCEGRRREAINSFISFLQSSVTAVELCSVPVIAAVSGHCIGGAVDLITAADMRYCTKSAKFSVKEIDLAIVVDMGTGQRLPKVVNNSQWAAEVCYTGRTFGAEEALAQGLVLQVFDTEADMLKHVQSVAQQIAEKSPLTVRGLKRSLRYSRDHSVAEGLEHVQMLNSAMLLSNDLLTAAQSIMEKKKPVYKGN